MKRALLFISVLFITTATVHGAMRKTAQNIKLGETEVRINVYENPLAGVTFFAPHYNEQISRNLAREYVERNGGRLIEIESYDERGNASRFVKFKINNKTYSFDPNRIYTENGRNCSNYAPEIAPLVEKFADEILQILFAADGKALRSGEKFIVAVHNNADIDAKEKSAQTSDLTATAFIRSSNTERIANGAYQDQAEGIYLSNTEDDVDNFVFLSTPAYISHFAEKGFNIVIQKSPARLDSKQCTVDDGSLSIYAARENIPYINLEADGANGAFRQRQMIEAIYALLPEQKQVEQTTAAIKK